MLVPQRVIEHLDGVVSGATAGWGHRISGRAAAAPRIDTEAAGVIVAQQFARHFRDAIHGGRPLDCDLWRAITRGQGTEGARGVSTGQ
jgi:hypothetical protein